MENFFTRYRNATVLAVVLFLQIFALAVQVKRPEDPRHPEAGSVRLIRVWVVTVITPFEKALVSSSHWVRNLWASYVDLRGVAQENREKNAEIERLKLSQAQLSEEARQARRLQVLLDFKQQSALETVAARVIGTGGSEQSRLLYLDKGSNDGIRPDMPVITPDGVVGKTREVYAGTTQVLVINDANSGLGAALEVSRLQGILRGTPAGDTVLLYVMKDEKVSPGDRLVTSGGDRVFPKGLPVGTVIEVKPGSDLFYSIRVKPAANLGRLEEVLVVTRAPHPQTDEGQAPMRASDIINSHLPNYSPKPKEEQPASNRSTPGAAPAPAGDPTPPLPQGDPR